MNNIKQALESAIEALNLINNHAFRCGIAYEAIKACKAALTEVEASSTNKNSNVLLDKGEPQQKWVGLVSTDIECLEFYDVCQNYRHSTDNDDVCNAYQQLKEYIAQTTSTKLKQLNTKGYL